MGVSKNWNVKGKYLVDAVTGPALWTSFANPSVLI